ncbi:MAG: bifunctional hydroxymethylpyrimidine kinase/phosphomethylpyrimidine kinase [Thermomicrobiales bacterium]
MTTSPLPRALTIAGSDSGGGAGIQADLKTFSAFGVYGMSVLTAITAQNTVGVQGVETLTPAFIRLQFESVVSDIGVDALKTGMLGTAAVVTAVAAMIAEAGLTNLVVDPVMVAKSGDHLLAEDAVHALRTRLLPLALVITPNVPEAETLVGGPIQTLDDMQAAARRLHALGPRWVVVKGGHMGGETVTDLLYDGSAFQSLDTPRIETPHTHGTGCTFSAAMTACLAQGRSVPDAFAAAKRYTHAAIAAAPGLGHGHGPLNHLVNLKGS